MPQFYHAVQLPLFVFSRVCTKCNTEKPLEAFELSENGLYGRRADCKQCRQLQRRERELHPKVKIIPRPGYKFCTACGFEKSLDKFYAHKHGFGGRDPHCKDCRAVYESTLKKTPEYRERDRIQHRENKQYWATHYLTNKEAYRANGREWRRANPERARAGALRRKAHKLKAVVEPVNYKHVLDRDGYICYICEKPIDPAISSRRSAGLTFDHKIPLQPRPGEPQGSHTEDNIHPAHHACNVRKGNIPFEQLTPWQRRGI